MPTKHQRNPEPDRQSSAVAPDLVWGIHPVMELLRRRPRQIKEIIILKDKPGDRLEELINLARQHGVRVRFETKAENDQTQGLKHQGVLARIAPYATMTADELIARLQPVEQPPILLALDSIQDPHNLGAIVRTASAAGVTAVILTKDRSAPLAGSAAKVSAGALAHIDICLATNLAVTLDRLKQLGFWIYGADMEGSRSIYQADFSGPVCLVVGGEGKGLRPLVKRKCDFLVAIPMAGALDSLNASVAAAVILFEMRRSRLGGK